tara:strand:- start:869 stop:1315 length:447 start_codon:yes stop_codon:yes gene_type:complete
MTRVTQGTKFFNGGNTELQREINKLKEKIACCTEKTPIVEYTGDGTFDMPSDWANSYVRVTGGSGVSNRVVIPIDATYNFPIGTEVTIFWDNAAAATGWSLRPGAPPLPLLNFYSPTAIATCTIAADKSAITLKKIGSNEWDVVGNIL